MTRTIRQHHERIRDFDKQLAGLDKKAERTRYGCIVVSAIVTVASIIAAFWQPVPYVVLAPAAALACLASVYVMPGYAEGWEHDWILASIEDEYKAIRELRISRTCGNCQNFQSPTSDDQGMCVLNPPGPGIAGFPCTRSHWSCAQFKKSTTAVPDLPNDPIPNGDSAQ